MSRLKVKESLKVRKKMAKLIEITGKALSGERMMKQVMVFQFLEQLTLLMKVL